MAESEYVAREYELARLTKEMGGLMQVALNIFEQRQRKYGSANIAKRGPQGVLVRLDDKFARLEMAITQQTGGDADDETVADTCLDIVNYALILLLCHQHKWPGWPHQMLRVADQALVNYGESVTDGCGPKDVPKGWKGRD